MSIDNIGDIYHTKDWNLGMEILDLQSCEISAVLSITKNKLPKSNLDMYTVAQIQHYSVSIEDLQMPDLLKATDKICHIMHHFLKDKNRILIRTSEESGICYAITAYYIYTYYKKNNKKPELSMVTQIQQKLQGTTVDNSMGLEYVRTLLAYENKLVKEVS